MSFTFINSGLCGLAGAPIGWLSPNASASDPVILFDQSALNLIAGPPNDGGFVFEDRSEAMSPSDNLPDAFTLSGGMEGAAPSMELSSSVSGDALQRRAKSFVKISVRGSGAAPVGSDLKSPRRVDLTQYREVLERGARAGEDLAQYDRLFREIEPEDGGVLAEATLSIPHEFEEMEPEQDGTSLGRTELTFSQSADRIHGGASTKIVLSVQPKSGASLFVVKHERVHAADYLHLPEIYHGTISTIPEAESSLDDIYRAVLSGRLMDEAMAFTAEIRLAQIFEERTGQSIYSFGAQKRFEKQHNEILPHYQAGGIKGVYEWMKTNEAYLLYKIASLYFGILVKQRATQFPDWESILKGVGIESQDGGFHLNVEMLQHFHEQFILPRLRKHWANIALVIKGLSPDDKAIFSRAMKYFKGDMIHEERVKFLKNDFDQIVPILGLLFGDKIVGEERDIGEALAEVEGVRQLPARPRPMRNDFPDDIEERPEVVADKVQVTGKLVEILYRTNQASVDMVRQHFDAYLAYAEHCDPESSRQVYARLEAIVKKESSNKFGLGFQLGLSMLRSGYIAEGRERLKEAIAHYGGYLPADLRHDALADLLDADQVDLVDSLVDRVISVPRKRMNAFRDEIKEAERKGYNPDSYRWENDLTGIPYLIEWFSRETLTDEQMARISPVTREKVSNAAGELWDLLKRGIPVKLEAYRRRYAPHKKSFESASEVFAVNPQWGGGGSSPIEDHMRVVGEPDHNYQGDPSPRLIQGLLSSPMFFEQGLRCLYEYQECIGRVTLFGYAATHMPKVFPDEKRKAFVRAYEISLEKNRQALADWNFMEKYSFWNSKDLQQSKDRATYTRYEKTHFYQEHRIRMAEVLMGGKGSDIKEDGYIRLLALPRDRAGVYNPVDWRRSYNVPAYNRAKAIIEHINDVPVSERPALLRKVYDELLGVFLTSIDDPHSTNYYVFEVADQILDLAVLSVKKGWNDLAIRIIDEWESFVGASLKEELKADPNASRFTKPDDLWELRNVRARTLSPLIHAMADKDMAAVTRLAERVEHDVKTDRRQFPVSRILEAISILSDEAVCAVFLSHRDELDEVIERLSKAAIDLYVRSVGEKKFSGGAPEYFTEEFAPLIDALKGLPFSNGKKDDIFCYLIGTATPEPGVMANDKSDYGSVYQGFEALKFIVGNKDMPKSDAALLDRFARALKDLPKSSRDPRPRGALYFLAWLFEKIADAHYLDAAQREKLAALRPQDASYEEAMAALHLYAGAKSAKVELKTVRARYLAAEESGDIETLRRMIPEIMSAQSRELNSLLDETEGNDRVVDLKGTMTLALYKDWQSARKRTDTQLEEILFDLWTSADDAGELKAKRALLFDEVINGDLPIEKRRQIFRNLTRTADISRYKKMRWEEVVRSGDARREAVLYRLSVPTVYRGRAIIPASDEQIALAMELSVEEAERLADRYDNFRDGYRNRGKYRMDPHDIFDWALWAFMDPEGKRQERGDVDGFRAAPAHIIVAMAAKVEGITDEDLSKRLDRYDYDGAMSLLQVAIERRLSGLIQGFPPHGVKIEVSRIISLLKYIGDGPFSEDDLKKAAGFYRALVSRYDLLHDQVLAAQFEMPKLFKDRDPLTQFMLSRFFMSMDPGEQQQLLRAMKDVPKEKALAIFFERAGLEKIGQFLSFWPEVPSEVRAELRHLQDDIEPSDFEEVKRTVIEQLGDTAQVRYLVQNMRPKPLGSGSIGECYISKLPDGTSVVVKVITPSKEARFMKAMERICEVHYKLGLYGDRIEGAGEAYRVMGMFLEMVLAEFDLRKEAANARTMSSAGLSRGVNIPECLPRLLSEKVAVQVFVDGVKIASLPDSSMRRDALTVLQSYLIDQVLKKGIYHSDMQPGNILVDPKTRRVWLIDFGQVGRLSEFERANVEQLMKVCMERNADELALVIEKMSDEKESDYSLKKLKAELRKVFMDRAPDMSGLSGFINNIFKAASRSGLVIGLNYLQLLKALATFEATSKDAQP